MGGLPSAVTNESIICKNTCPRKNVAEAVMCDMASSDWLKLLALCLARKVYLKVNAFVTVLGQDRKVIDLIHSCFEIHVT